jgi:uncharacterized protein (DUF302 family)
MKHDEIVQNLAAEAENNPNILGLLVYGSVANGTQREDSDLDLMTILQTCKPSSGVKHKTINGIQVGNIFFTYDVLATGVKRVPYLMHPLAKARLLFDRDGRIKPQHERIQSYFAEHPEITAEWDRYIQQLRQEKARYGHELTTIVDVWNELEKRYSAGKTRRPFFNAFYMTNPRIFAFLKRFM